MFVNIMTIKITGERVYLTEMQEKDAHLLHEYSKEPKLNEYSGPYKASESLEKSKEYIANSKKNILKKDSYILGIYEKITSNFVGTIGFFDLDKEDKNGQLGFWVAKDYWNKGYMTDSVKLMTDYIFNVLKYHRVYAYTHEINKSVERVLSKAGYEKEGELKRTLKSKDGKYHNDIVYGIVNTS